MSDYYYNTKDVFAPKDYRGLEYNDDMLDDLDNKTVYFLIHPRYLEKKFRTREYQLALYTHKCFVDSNWLIDVEVRLVCNGNYVHLPSHCIMTIARQKDIEQWESLYGSFRLSYFSEEPNEDNEDDEYKIYDDINKAVNSAI